MGSTDQSNKRRRWLRLIAVVAVIWVGIWLALSFFPEEEKELRRGFRNAVEETFPEQTAEVTRSFGLARYGGESTEPTTTISTWPCVVLIHGLDDPGKVWMNLAPALEDSKINVWELRYPNDQPIVESASFFVGELHESRQLGCRRIAIVAHSMGGLVSREMLTSPTIAYQEKARVEEVPEVIGLIMVGTPNHGSELARFRVLGELRDQFANLVKGEGHILRGIVDGAGEAKIDLLPDSQFLQKLNARPQPEDVSMLIVAGVASPWNAADVDEFIASLTDEAPAEGQDVLAEMGDFLKSMSDGVGDGLVTVESTRLEGVEQRMVQGSHLSMIRNITSTSDRIPPAVPVVIEQLDHLFADNPSR